MYLSLQEMLMVWQIILFTLGMQQPCPQIFLVNRILIHSRVTLCFKKAGLTLTLD